MPRYRVYTGPAFVGQWSDKFRAGGFQNVLEGTEHVHFDSEADIWHVIPLVYEKVGYLPSVRELQIIRQ
jgi:hypothetical protein